jgi:glutathione S-transferase
MWALNHLEPCGIMLIQNFMKPEAERDPGTHDKVRELWNPSLDVLEAQLSHHDYILGDRFTVADVNVASCMGPAARTGYDLSDHPKVAAWFKACMTRPASAAAREVTAAA